MVGFIAAIKASFSIRPFCKKRNWEKLALMCVPAQNKIHLVLNALVDSNRVVIYHNDGLVRMSLAKNIG